MKLLFMLWYGRGRWFPQLHAAVSQCLFYVHLRFSDNSSIPYFLKCQFMVFVYRPYPIDPNSCISQFSKCAGQGSRVPPLHILIYSISIAEPITHNSLVVLRLDMLLFTISPYYSGVQKQAAVFPLCEEYHHYNVCSSRRTTFNCKGMKAVLCLIQSQSTQRGIRVGKRITVLVQAPSLIRLRARNIPTTSLGVPCQRFNAESLLCTLNGGSPLCHIISLYLVANYYVSNTTQYWQFVHTLALRTVDKTNGGQNYNN